MDDKNLKYYLELSADADIGSKTILKLKKYFKSIDKLFDIKNIKKLETLQLKKDIKFKVIQKVKLQSFEQSERIRKFGIGAISIESKKYPKILKELSDPPALLYYRGDIHTLKGINISIVGSRKYSSYGRQAAYDLSSKLSNAGATIISGLALGIDAIAHKACVDNNALTIAVLACGLDQVYPSSNISLAKKIIQKKGLIISEYPPGTPPYKSNFPLRNRIIAGLSLATIVIEAARKSGTLLTAKAALDYNREVFAVPGNIYSVTSEGANNLIKYGANILTGYKDVIDVLNLEEKKEQKKARKIFADNKFESLIINSLDRVETTHIDELSRKCGLEIEVLNATLVLMEMKGKVRNIGGNNYILANI